MNESFLTSSFGRQVRDLEQQLILSTQQSRVLTVEEELLGMGVLHKTPPQIRNVNYIRSIEKEKKEAFEVYKHLL